MTHIPLAAWIEGIGFLAPGLPDWPTARAVLRGEQPFTSAASVLPAPNILPPAERRRASRIVKLTLAVGLEAATQADADVGTLATVFSASGADGYNCHALCEQLATDDRQISPTRFHNSVHNATAGYWGIATKSMAPCQVLCAYDASFGAGLLDALAQVVVDRSANAAHRLRQRISGTAAQQARYTGLRGSRAAADAGKDRPLAGAHHRDASRRAADLLADSGMESLRQKIPALRCLPLLQKLARGESGDVCLDYLPPMQLQVRVQSC